VVPYGETPVRPCSGSDGGIGGEAQLATEFDRGVLTGLLVGEGHFGGDGRQPQITLRMHVRHESLFRWLERTFPGGRLYGPYSHGGRDYFQWMVRGTYLRDEILPFLAASIRPELDAHVSERLSQMRARYPGRLPETPGELRGEAPDEGEPGSGTLRRT